LKVARKSFGRRFRRGDLDLSSPGHEKHERLRQLAARHQLSMNKLLEAETRFRARAARGSREEGLRLLDELDRRG
jgi:hypothetical protein